MMERGPKEWRVSNGSLDSKNEKCLQAGCKYEDLIMRMLYAMLICVICERYDEICLLKFLSELFPRHDGASAMCTPSKLSAR
jgi:hypothetical protein